MHLSPDSAAHTCAVLKRQSNCGRSQFLGQQNVTSAFAYLGDFGDSRGCQELFDEAEDHKLVELDLLGTQQDDRERQRFLREVVEVVLVLQHVSQQTSVEVSHFGQLVGFEHLLHDNVVFEGEEGLEDLLGGVGLCLQTDVDHFLRIFF